MSHDATRGHALSLEEVVDLCLDDLVMDRASIEDCLGRYPAHRTALEPILRMAMAVGELPVAQVEAEPGHRDAFMAALRETPQ